jgi:hypothetical protein
VTSSSDGNWVKTFLALPVERAPGTHFVYNSAATYMLSAIIQKLTGGTLMEYLRPRLFEPLRIAGATWETCPRGISIGGWGLSVKTEDIARFGQLYLQRGNWNGRQLVPEKWIEEATSKQISNGTSETSDWAQGYGYQFWRCRHGAYRGDGAFGQFCIVMPHQDAVLAITSGVPDMQAVMNAAWDYLLPGMQRDTLLVSNAAPDIDHRLDQLSVRPPEGKPTSPTVERISGRAYRLEANEEKVQSAMLKFKKNRCTMTLADEQGGRPIECGIGAWVKGTAAIGNRPPSKVAACGAWTDDDTYTIKLCLYETPFVQTVTWKFEGDHVTIDRKMNVGFGPTERPPLVGRLA